MIQEYPLGIGGYSTSSYNQIALRRGIPLNESGTGALIVHNGFLSAGVKYGILGLILFSLFMFTSVFNFLKNSVQKGKNWYPLLMIMVVFLIYNLTNDFSFLGTQIALSLAWLVGGYAAVNNPTTKHSDTLGH
jgi:O-antigen ligase